eukprot:SAG11_NODE_24284_length_375_cov_1.688406_2_plen_50_part_01
MGADPGRAEQLPKLPAQTDVGELWLEPPHLCTPVTGLLLNDLTFCKRRVV